MRRALDPVVHLDAREIATSFAQVRESIEAAERQRIALRLTVMQTKARIAEVKATLRRFQRFLHPPAG